LAAHRLHEAIRDATGLNCSIGASRTRLVSKIASDQAKPNGVLWIPPGNEAEFLAPLPASRIPGVGKVTAAALTELGIRRIGDLAALEEAFLARRFGKWGLALAGKAHGEDAGGWFDAAVGEDADPKSISHEHTFGEDTADPQKLEGTLDRLSEMVAERMRAAHLFGRTVHLKLRYQDFTTLTRAKTLAERSAVDRVIGDAARAMFRRAWKAGERVRLLGVGVSGLEREAGQANLFDDGRWSKALNAVDDLRRRFGPDTVSLARGLKSKFRERTHEALPTREEDQSDSRRSPKRRSRPDSAR
jgi:DNA polymerase-4